ncbi:MULTISPECIES: HoxN/HupN/NixA family nickel/cobalt transporter [unclassified Sphingobium]|uniref:HoxN/HupN/NixA family nickel/cobalt transporter n=1 Tax=unclassified Sphingobium TaxID=2611147 RepID=UPI0007F423CA|nr:MULTISPECIES: HoxN/HupN/NixA family nickel/cobalt transporter [unclassified Sphingobium]OAN52510.1 nickel transporter [Sphingobium sp. TCM1]WIW90817.1 HoxN/HupN/NixA family nickel/cobalt transporter [Sphingobium sp. V4]
MVHPEISSAPRLRHRVTGLMGALVAANVAVWLWAIAQFHAQPLMLGTALLAWGLGLRHAVDADHIAAIDNVTRKLMQDGQRPITVGFWFAIGHSAIIAVASVTIALTASALSRFESFREIGGVVATSVSALFLFTIAVMNLMILRSVWKSFAHVRAGGAYVEEDLDLLLGNRGLLSRLFRPMFRLVRRSWHMAPLGFLFGLGFDTATEVAILGLSASQAADGVAIGTVLVLPALFAAGMALVDTADGVVMLGAYEWAFVKPIRKLYYNITITLISALVAIVIGGIETMALVGDKLGLDGAPWRIAADLGEHFNSLGFAIIGLFVLCWALSFGIYRWKRFDEIEVRVAG